uniref:Kinesin motor domain-containing protein n=1 Tax=Chromera velia CCMP2878 TaxID=1169474 RepID=A0A0G4FCX4_9ALVE|eukprot:Cvel_16255.t1-p1 / transcript=Cvel_16255.t1 / gene=Cvel_16255 / organism=Chromera_velia_CCMP2878 / gene_product=Kinesin-like protein KIF13A, putative / transcript_product=Kinesin-like protein KIF13A, putative / location=Cvel_scaffold1244:1711-12084(+) / protein_length=1160 / sequence_SO=supercontig / SO=protein_coding / is_pseudo=false
MTFDTDPSSGLLTPSSSSSNYADQEKVFDALGRQVLNNAWEGYHCCLFAYGQTGSGKSYSMMGYGANRGIVPKSCEEIFKRIAENTEPSKVFQVSCSMMEIYNECVHDLLQPPATRKKGGLEIRESKQLGVFVPQLSSRAVSSFEDIEKVIDQGNRHRSIGATLMNMTSSRAHTVLSIEFAQKGLSGTKRSVIHLVDLAGSEKNSQTGASGDRLKEGCAINKSLSVLGNVICTLADLASGRRKSAVIPYRDSRLTRILQNALGGSCQTVMVCAISPVDRAKKIKNHAVINEDPTDALLRGLKEENERLKALLSGGGSASARMSMLEDEEKENEEMERLRREQEEEIKAMESQIREMSKSWEQKLREAREAAAAASASSGVESFHPSTASSSSSSSTSSSAAFERSKSRAEIEAGAHLTNVNADPILSGRLSFALPSKPSKPVCIGRKAGGGGGGGGASQADIQLPGVSIEERHCKIERDDNGGLVLVVEDGAEGTFVNGKSPAKGTRVSLNHGDRVVLGADFCYAFVVCLPGNDREDTLTNTPHTQMMREVAAQQGHLKDRSGAILKREKERAELERRLNVALDGQRRAEKAAKESLARKEKEMIEEIQLWEARRKSTEEISEHRKRLFRELAAFRRESEEALLRLRLEVDHLRGELKEAETEAQRAEEEERFLEERLMIVLPLVREANLIAKKLSKPYHLDCAISVSREANNFRNSSLGRSAQTQRSSRRRRADVTVPVTYQGEHVYDWSLDILDNRIFLMRDWFENFIEAGEEGSGCLAFLEEEEDPWWDPIPGDRPIGTAQLLLEPLSMQLESESTVRVVDSSGRVAGSLQVGVFPVSPEGGEVAEECLVEDPEELIGTRMDFKVKILSAAGLPARLSTEVRVSFKWFLGDTTAGDEKDKEEGKPAAFVAHALERQSENPSFLWEKHIMQETVTPLFLQWLQTGFLSFEVSGQDAKAAAAAASRVYRGSRTEFGESAPTSSRASRVASPLWSPSSSRPDSRHVTVTSPQAAAAQAAAAAASVARPWSAQGGSIGGVARFLAPPLPGESDGSGDLYGTEGGAHNSNSRMRMNRARTRSLPAVLEEDEGGEESTRRGDTFRDRDNNTRRSSAIAETRRNSAIAETTERAKPRYARIRKEVPRNEELLAANQKTRACAVQ